MASHSYKYGFALGHPVLFSAVRVRDEVQQDTNSNEIRVELLDYIPLIKKPTELELIALIKVVPLIEARIGLCTSMTKEEFETIRTITA